MRGLFIALEGGEGSGKSTQAALLAEALRKEGREVELTREPGGTPGAEAIRSLLLDPPGKQWGARAEALLFAAARSDHVQQRIAPALEAGRWVICDRFLDSSRAYQGGAGGLGDELVLSLHEAGSEGLRPDLTLLITLRPEFVVERLQRRDMGNSDAIGGRPAEYHAGVADTFDKLAQAEPERFRVIDGHGDVSVVHERILDAVKELERSAP